MIRGSGDVEAPRVKGNEEDPLELERVKEETLESCLIDFSTWTFSIKRKRSNQGKRTVHRESSANLFGMRVALDMTPKDMVKEFLINSVQVSSIYCLLKNIALENIIYDIYISTKLQHF